MTGHPSTASPEARTIIFSAADADFGEWSRLARLEAPYLTLIDDISAAARDPGIRHPGARYCLVWRPRRGFYARIPDLRVIFALGAGIERLLADPELPPDIPLVKMAEPGLTEAMNHYVLWQVLNHHRRFWELEAAQRDLRWLRQDYPAPWDRRVGVMGLGALGEVVAGTLRDFGFQARGWSRSAKSIPGVACFAGPEQMADFLDGLEILVCLLPLTPGTRGILNADLFRRLAPGAGLVNAARGGHLNESDLLLALESGQITAASLDVTSVEPLPKEHPFWRHPRIFITPHNAADTAPGTGLKEIARHIARFETGQPLEHVVDRSRGY
jgi:glyoxylate/hydroxypyruvate reductase A